MRTHKIHASLFSGIGGPEVAAAMLGWDNAFHCEINPFGRKVLEYWFPDSVSYEDITQTDFTQWRGKVDILTGGFPCQPFSYAGKRGGREDERYLWPEMCRAIQEIRPTWVVGENVAGITTMVEGGILTEVGEEMPLFEPENIIHGYELEQSFTIERICKDFEALGYEVQPMLIPAAACGAPHRRDRVFFIAFNAQDPNYDGRGQREYEIEGSQRLFRHPCSGDSPRLRPEAGADASHSNGRGRRQVGQHVQPGRCEDSKKGRAGLHHRVVGPCKHGPTADTFRERLSASIQRGCYGAEERDGTRRPTQFASDNAWLEGTWWDHFPTVAPVHRGNDGIPFRLDDLTVSQSKWRTESLKAYGNAIVPQVMFRIFQAIDELKELKN